MKLILVLLALLLAEAPAAADRVDDLAAAAVKTWPKLLSQSRAREIVTAAISAETAALPVTLLLGIAAVESHFDPLVRNAYRFCGITQANAGNKARCTRLRDSSAAFVQTVKQISRRLRANGGDVPRALSGYGCGGPDTRTAQCSYKRRGGYYDERVFAAQHAVEMQLATHPAIRPGS